MKGILQMDDFLKSFLHYKDINYKESSMETNKKILPKTKDNVSFLYLEYCKIERQDYGIIAIRGDEQIFIPVANLNTLLIGPGCSVTHGAINVISASGCNVVWCGDHMTRFYSFDAAEIRSSKNLLTQIEYFSTDENRLKIVRKMYRKRYKDVPVNDLSLKELRGIEGIKVKETYKFYAKFYKVKWTIRKSQINEEQDLINEILTYLNQMLYAICHGIILSLGFSPAIGFIHTGNMESFVFDVADFYKEELIIPLAFQIHNKLPEDFKQGYCRTKFREMVIEKKLMSRITGDLLTLFSSSDDEIDVSVDELWDLNSLVPGSTNYGGAES